jgi:hypothetical protein
MNTTGESVDTFDDCGYAVVRGLLPQAAHAFLHDYGMKAAQTGKLQMEKKQVPGTPFSYGDPLMEALLESLLPRLEAETGRALHPTYSYFRVYRHGDVLHRHSDRPACEVSVTVSLGSDRTWPIWIEPARGKVEVRLQPGDGLIYQGIRVPHWREAFDGNDAVQVFLHYVEQGGPNREWMFDKRPRLATSAAARQIIGRLVASDLQMPAGSRGR